MLIRSLHEDRTTTRLLGDLKAFDGDKLIIEEIHQSIDKFVAKESGTSTTRSRSSGW